MGVLEFLLLLTLIAVVVFLVTGIVAMASEDEKMHDKSNMMMRLRVISQGLAIAMIALLIYLTRSP